MKEIVTYLIKSENELQQLAKDLVKHFKHSLVLLVGDLGAGKTTLVKQLKTEYGSTDVGSSPSFSLINEYTGKNQKIYHIDLYRLNEADEAFQLGIEEYIYSDNMCFIEWPQLIIDYLHPPFHVILSLIHI